MKYQLIKPYKTKSLYEIIINGNKIGTVKKDGSYWIAFNNSCDTKTKTARLTRKEAIEDFIEVSK